MILSPGFKFSSSLKDTGIVTCPLGVIAYAFILPPDKSITYYNNSNTFCYCQVAIVFMEYVLFLNTFVNVLLSLSWGRFFLFGILPPYLLEFMKY